MGFGGTRGAGLRAGQALLLSLAVTASLGARAAAPARPVVVIRTSELGPYTEVQKAFVEALGQPVQALDLGSTDGKSKAKAALGGAGLIFCLGPGAAQLVAEEKPAVPMIYALVPNAEKLGLPRESGVPLFVAARRQVRGIKAVLPAAKTLGLVYNPGLNEQAARELETAAKVEGLTLVAATVTDRSGVAPAVKAMIGKADALWLLPDTVVTTSETFRFMVNISLTNKLPLIGFTSTMGKAGALVAFEAEYAEVGKAAAAAALKALAGGTARPDTEGLMYLNGKTAEIMGVTLSPAAKAMATKVFE
ncbi:MAG: hypothetical protein IPJ65_42345 [Archangiaceae bacterium]|nr:hypothetical protein [Archangiaceae bacterium]